jgi:hypothetical protein
MQHGETDDFFPFIADDHIVIGHLAVRGMTREGLNNSGFWSVGDENTGNPSDCCVEF